MKVIYQFLISLHWRDNLRKWLKHYRHLICWSLQELIRNQSYYVRQPSVRKSQRYSYKKIDSVNNENQISFFLYYKFTMMKTSICNYLHSRNRTFMSFINLPLHLVYRSENHYVAIIKRKKIVSASYINT